MSSGGKVICRHFCILICFSHPIFTEFVMPCLAIMASTWLKLVFKLSSFLYGIYVF